MSEFSLEQVSKVLSVTDGKLRYWQRIGLFPRRNEGYDWADLQKAKLLKRLVGEGVPATHLLPYAPLLEGHELYGYQRALVVDGEDGFRELESGQYLLGFSEADSESERQVHYLPQSEEWEQQARSAYYDGDHPRALELAQSGMKASLEDASALNHLGLIFLDLDRPDLAVEALERACHLPDAGPRQWFNLAHAMEAVNRPETAIEALEEALALDPDFSAARFNIAYTCEALGHSGRAYLHWKAFLDRHPESEDSPKVREHLQRFYGGGQVVPLRSSR